MFLVVLYMSAGVYLLLMAFGLLHREFMRTVNRNRRKGLIALGGGFLILGLIYLNIYLA